MKMRMRSATNIQGNKIRVLVLGASGVGKSTLVKLFTQKKFIEDFEDQNSQEAGTIIVELMEVEVSLLVALKRLAIKTAQAYILMYSFADPGSFEFIINVKQEIVEMKGEGMPIVVVGNKADLSRRQVQEMSKKSVVSDWGLPYTDVSLHTGMNIGGVYRHLFSHPTLQKLVDVVAVIKASTISSNIRRMSLPASQLQRRVSTLNMTVPEMAVPEAGHASDKSPEIGRYNAVREQKHGTSRWSKFKQLFTGRKARK
ncbi:ras-related protein Rap-2a-like [Mercenaria mercenaria]|uniref:ras-related protein Rap-2a-like n=1 Tax=Mercenaria mercenaria TaxID=6596 RepID=UPI00234EC7DB|nr:ras-related protein Rap-2a-like [Mercenaria mercenaria]